MFFYLKKNVRFFFNGEYKYSMAEDSDGNENLTAVVICEGDYHDPAFPQKLNKLVARLNSLIDEQPKSKRLKVNKVN